MATDVPFFFPCKTCGAQQFLIRGLCARCAPDLHRGFLEAMAAYEADAARFKAATGRDALSAWDEFEDWLKANPAPPPASADEGSAP